MTDDTSPIEPASDDATPTPAFSQPIHARAVRAGFHFWKIIVMGLLVAGYAGAYFLYDGFVRYPQDNAKVATLDAEIDRLQTSHADDEALAKLTRERKGVQPHVGYDVPLQRAIGFICLPLGLFIIARHLRTVRGEYVLADDVLSLPDGRRIPIGAIADVRNAKWEAKAIAGFSYRLPDGASGDFKLDALAFDTKPTDAIHDAIVARVSNRT